MEGHMKTIKDLDELTRRTRRREFEDGLDDLQVGLIMLGVGILGWYIFSGRGPRLLIQAWAAAREITALAMIGMIGLLVFLAFGSRRLINAVRTTTFWGERGFVRGLPWQVSRPVSLISVAIGLIMIVGSFWLYERGLLSEGTLLRTMVGSTGVSTGIVYLGMGLDLHLRRHVIVGIIGALCSAAIIPADLSFALAWLALGMGWMVILAASGLWAMRERLLSSEGRHGG
jgi:hypothetical protein